MSTSTTPIGDGARTLAPIKSDTFRSALQKLASGGLALASILLLAPSMSAQQTVNVQSEPLIITVSDATTNTTVLTNQVVIGGGSNEVDLSISGLPAGADATFSQTAFTNTGGAILTVTTTNIPQGVYALGLNATNAATNSLILTLQSGRMWNNVTNNWSSTASWVGGVVPGVSDDVLFTQFGAQSTTNVNSTVDVNTEISSLRFSQTNNTTRFHNILINPGIQLSVTGTKGLSLLRDFTGVGSQMDVNFTGPGGTLLVSNETANISVEIDNQQSHRFDLSGLGTFVTDVNRIAFGDFRAYPNYTNLTANGYGGAASFLIPRRFIPSIRLARTNIIRATWSDPYNYTNAGVRDYAMTFENNDIGTTSDGTFFFGLTNAFFLDSVCFVQSSAQAEVANEMVFNAAFAANNPVAYFRGTNGDRMPVFVIADAAGPGASGTSSKGLLDFSRGIVDIQVDRLLLGRDRTNSSDNASAEAVLTVARGTIDANTAILGDQDNGNNLNVGGTAPTGYARGTVNVNTNAVFVVNNEMALGYTTADITDQRQAGQGFGRLFINNNGIVRANTITCGGITKATTNSPLQNTITITGNGNLIVTNTVGSPDAYLGTLTLNGGAARLTFANVNSATTNVCVMTLAGTGGIIELLSVPGPGTYPLISYGGTSASLQLVLPQGFYGFFDNDTASQVIKAVVSTNPPRNLLWKGNVSGDWDTTTANWVDLATLGATIFTNGDAAVFDDTAANFTVNVVGTVIPAGGTTVSNLTQNYTFTGGTIAGLGTTVKLGGASLTMDATHNPPLTISNGTFSVTAAGVLGGGLTTYSPTTLSNIGTINGPVSIQVGAFVNAGTVSTAPGLMTLAAGTLVTNYTTLNAGGGTWIVPLGATLVNYDTINNLNGRLNVAGTMIGTGTVHDGTGVPNTGSDGRLAINSGGVLSVGNSIGTLNVEGRFDASSGGNIIVEVDFANPQTNDLLTVDFAGNMQATFTMSNIDPGAGVFSNGQSFVIMRGNLGLILTNASTSHVPRVSPTVPGVGLQWNVAGMLITNNLRTISIVPVQTTNPPAITPTVIGGTTLSLTWPAASFGYQLQVQTNSLEVGLSTNWVPLAGSEQTNRVDVPINKSNPSVFYRLSNH